MKKILINVFLPILVISMTFGFQLGQTQAAATFSSGSLVNDNGTVYIIRGTQKVGFTTWQSFVDLGYNPKNIVKGDTSSYSPSTFFAVDNAAHPWGSWLSSNGTIYYSTQAGLIGVPNQEVFTSNGGQWSYVVPANKYDITNISTNSVLLADNDSRIYSGSTLTPPIACPLTSGSAAPGCNSPWTPTTPSTNVSAPANQSNSNSSLPSQLKELGDLHLINDAAAGSSPQIAYYEVQGISYNGEKIVDAVDSFCDGEGCTPSFYRFVQNGNSYTLLTKYSSNIVQDASNGGDTTTEPSSGIDVPALDLPDFITDPKTGATITYNTSSDLSGNFFDPSSKQAFFTAGNTVVYVDQNSNNENFYASGPDGKELNFYIQNTFADTATDNSLPITWNDQQSHGGLYNPDPLDQCSEGAAYVNAMTGRTITENDLTVVGTDPNGANIYEFKNANDSALIAAQQQIDALRADGSGNNNDSKRQVDDVIFWKDPFGRLMRYVTADMQDFCGGKPVIYLYPTTTTTVNVQVNPEGGMSKSIPIYNDGWNVVAHPNGTITEGDSSYPYLFWEGGLGAYQTPKDGFVVPTNGVKSLLDTKLQMIGLNGKEISDFEEFWLSKMESAPYYFVTFTMNSQMDQYAPLTINPKPDTVIRVMMDYKPLSSDEKVEPLELTNTPRKGFTVVEWGGILK